MPPTNGRMTALPSPRTESQRLLVGCLLAMAFHAALLFGISIRPARMAPPTLEVTLVTIAASSAPWQAHVLAPEAQRGSGLDPNERARAAHSAGMIDVPGIRSARDASIATPANAQSNSNGQQGNTAAVRALTTTSESWRQNSAETMPQAGADAQRRLIQREQPGLGAKDAEFNQLASAPGKPDPAAPIAPNARRDPSAAYIDIWRREVERVGSANFPWDALVMGRSNSLTLAVAIRADGSVAQARIERSSGLPMLDRAALHILSMAAPFPAFPEPLRHNTGEIRFSYVWEFLPGDSASGGGALHVSGQ